MHSHLSENVDYLVFCREKFRHAARGALREHEWLGRDVWFAHLCHVSDSEIELMARAGTGIAHCPGANCRLGSGIAPAPRMQAAGMPVSLGVDGPRQEPGDILAEAHLAWYLHRARRARAARPTRRRRVSWRTSFTGARGRRTGARPEDRRARPGYAADVAVYELTDPRHFGLHDPAIAPVASGGRPHLRRLVCGGKTIVEDDRIPGLDLAELAAQARAAVGKLRFH